MDDPPFVDHVAHKVRTLAAVKPALVRLLEWQIDEALKNAPNVTAGFAELVQPTRHSMRLEPVARLVVEECPGEGPA